MNTLGSVTTQAASSRIQPDVTDAAMTSIEEVTAIQAIGIIKATKIRQTARIREAAKAAQVDRTVQPAITTQTNGGRLYRASY